MGKKKKRPTVFFNASVILAGLKSPRGGSARLIFWVQEGKIKGIISELILDEVERNLSKLSLTKRNLVKLSDFRLILAPKGSLVEKFKKKVVDHGDAHVLASAKEEGVDYLVSLDKKHLLILKNKVGKIKIVSPKELIEALSF